MGIDHTMHSSRRALISRLYPRAIYSRGYILGVTGALIPLSSEGYSFHEALISYGAFIPSDTSDVLRSLPPSLIHL